MQVSTVAGHMIILFTESQWYDVTDEKREYFKMTAKLRAEQESCEGVSIMVQPDDLLSRMPSPNKLRVYTHNFPKPVEDEFYLELMALVGKFIKPGKMSIAEAKAVALKVFG